MVRLFCLISSLIGASIASSMSQCPITYTNQWFRGCDERGSVFAPSFLEKKVVPDFRSCAQTCERHINCKSFRFINGVGYDDNHCILYRKYLDQMEFNRTEISKGQFYDRECFSSDCDTIAACTAVRKCYDFGYYHGTMKISYYACAYGVQAQSLNASYSSFLLPGKYPACTAARDCVRREGIYDSGSIDLHYLLKEKKWECKIYSDIDPPKHQPEYFYHAEHITRRRFTHRNSSIGPSYGYYINFEY